MLVKREYSLDPTQAVAAIEDIADSFMNREMFKETTLKGITFGINRETGRQLWPPTFNKRLHYQLAFGGNEYVVRQLLAGAKEIADTGFYGDWASPSERFNVAELISYNLRPGETVRSVLTEHGVLGRDDYQWYLGVIYGNGLLKCHMGDNTFHTTEDVDQGFKGLYERLFGEHIRSQMTAE